MISTKDLSLAVSIFCISSSAGGLTLEQSRQFQEKDYILKEGVTIEYRGKKRELFFLDKGRPFHYSRIEIEEDGDLFRWVELRELKQEKYVRYLASIRDPIPEIVVKEGFSSPFSGKTSPDTICELVKEHQLGKPENVYLVDFETQNFYPVLKQAVIDLRAELGLAITLEQAVLFFYNRCSTESYPLEQIKHEESMPEGIESLTSIEASLSQGQTLDSKEKREVENLNGVELTANNSPSQADIERNIKPVIDESVNKNEIQDRNILATEGFKSCDAIDNNIYQIADDARRESRLASFISQLEYEYSWDSGSDSSTKLFSLINIAYPIYVHYEELSDAHKIKFTRIIDNIYDTPDELFKQLSCNKRKAVNNIFDKVLGKLKKSLF